MSLSFTTKAGTLASLFGLLKYSSILKMYSFTVEDWQEKKLSCLAEVPINLGQGPWAVRSSSIREDGATLSNAGKFLSLLNVNSFGLESAILKVIDSYESAQLSDEVLIQPMLTNVVRSGVAFSHDPNTCAPYRTINWSEGCDTTMVTNGLGGRLWQSAAKNPYSAPKIFEQILLMLEELLVIFNQPIDCEFAVTSKGGAETLWLLQVRPLILLEKPESEIDQATSLEYIHHHVLRGMKAQPFLAGKQTVYGVMPDWNPAEIIGTRPKPLALSLYRDLVTDSVWAYQRHNYGYRNLRSFPLMPHFMGLPYVDVRVSFNSFIPADIDDKLAEKLVDYYIDRLIAEPSLHDKVEFEIIYSCYTLDHTERIALLTNFGFTDYEQKTLTNSLKNITNNILSPNDGFWKNDAAKINVLNTRRKQLLASEVDPLARIYWLLEDVKRYGTLPFAGLARAGFVAVQMLKSLVAVGVFSQEDYDSFINSVVTISRQLSFDRTTHSKASFLAKYGHLRPGTYDLLSPRYDEKPELYFDWTQSTAEVEPVRSFSITLPQMREITKLLEAHGLQSDPVRFFDFIQSGIELRELGKFHFTQNLSDAMEIMIEYGDQHGFSREDLSYCNISTFRELHIAAQNPTETLLRSIDHGKSEYARTLKITMPPLITKPEDVWAFEWPDSEPNFITQKKITAKVVGFNARDSLAGSIVCIPSADPGFDWLFSYPISGLITAWGGANSHMAIRAGELGLPSVIGAGELMYRRWSCAHRLHLDCSARRVEILP